MSPFNLTIDIQSDWHIGSGLESGAYADALIVRDHHQLPYLPGKSLKGLLRQAFQTAMDNHWFKETDHLTLARLFGEEKENGLTAQGLIQVTNAQLSDAETQYLNAHNDAKKFLVRTLQSTRIDSVSGVADDGSLRSIEVAVPMTLNAQVSLNPSMLADDNAIEIEQHVAQWLTDSITLITELGAKRLRGLGNVTMCCAVKLNN